MIPAGKYHKLAVGRITNHGLYLTNDQGDEVLLPNRYVSLSDAIGDSKDVFVYHDSEDRLVATTEKPYITVGHTAFLKVVGKSLHGAFLDWGLHGKDLFLPNRNMLGRVEEGHKYVVYAYEDKITGRTVATMALNQFISNTALDLQKEQQVDVMIARETEIGYRVVINDRFWGMLYKNQVFRPVSLGDKLTGYVRKITEDNRVDISLQQEGFDEVKNSADGLVEIIKNAGGHLPLNDDSDPSDIRNNLGMSKKVFKRTVGYLLKKGLITMDDNGIQLTDDE